MKSTPKSNPSQPPKYTYADYLSWPEDQRVELIDGVMYDMSPAPGPDHQMIVVELSWQLHSFFRGKPCKVFSAPFDVRFPEGKKRDEHESLEKDETVVQPDLLVICDPSKLDERGCVGAPDLVVEILSPSTSAKDRLTKLNLYEKHGVKEYWIVSPIGCNVMVFRLQKDGRYGKSEYANWTDTLSTPLFPGLVVDLKTVFPTDEPKKAVREPAAEYKISKEKRKRK